MFGKMYKYIDIFKLNNYFVFSRSERKGVRGKVGGEC